MLAALNGVLGDHLLATANPLAIRMSLRHEGQACRLKNRAGAAPARRHAASCWCWSTACA